MTRLLRNSSPTSGSNTTFVANMASPQSSSIAVSASVSLRAPCHSASEFHASTCAEPSKPSISSLSVRLYSARSWANRILRALLAASAVLCMFVGQERSLEAKT